MSRYVDVEPLDVVGTKGVNKDYVDGMAYVLDLLDNLPIADVVKVRHGHWINDIGYAGWTCSECGDHEGNKTDKYCHNCGAKMDGENE